MASKWTLAQYADDWWPDQVLQDISPDVVEYGISVGTTFTPLVAMTSERVVALRHITTWLHLNGTDDVMDSLVVVIDLLAEMEGAHDEA